MLYYGQHLYTDSVAGINTIDIRPYIQWDMDTVVGLYFSDSNPIPYTACTGTNITGSNGAYFTRSAGVRFLTSILKDIALIPFSDCRHYAMNIQYSALPEGDYIVHYRISFLSSEAFPLIVNCLITKKIPLYCFLHCYSRNILSAVMFLYTC